MLVSSIRITLDGFYLLVFKFEKLSTSAKNFFPGPLLHNCICPALFRSGQPFWGWWGGGGGGGGGGGRAPRVGENPWKEVSKSDLTIISFPHGFCGECGDFPDVKITFFFALNPSKKMWLQVINLAVESDSWLHYNRNFRQRKKHLL